MPILNKLRPQPQLISNLLPSVLASVHTAPQKFENQQLYFYGLANRPD